MTGSSAHAEAIAIGALLMLAYALLGFLRPFAAGTLDDDGVYLAVGKALAEGAGYRNIHLVHEPPNTNYPPGVPLLFALIWKIGGNLGVVQHMVVWLNLIVCGAAAGILWFVARARLLVTRSVTLLFVIAPLLLDVSVQHYHLAISEPYYLLGWAAVLLLFYQMRAESGRRQLGFAALLGLATAAVVGTRLQAIGVVPAVLLALAFEQRRGRLIAACLAGMILPALLLTVLFSGLPGFLTKVRAAPHLAWLGEGDVAQSVSLAIRAAGTNYLVYQVRLLHHLSSVPAIGYALLTLAQFLILGGALLLLRRHAVLVLTLAAGLAVVLFWPFNDLRLIAVLLPFAGMVAAAGVSRVLRAARSRVRHLVVLLLSIMALPVVVRQAQFGYYARAATVHGERPPLFTLAYSLRRNSDVITATADWVQQHIGAADHVMVAHTAGVYLRTGRKTVESNPPQSLFSDTGPRPFAQPGRFLASVILSEAVTVLVIEQKELRINADAAIVQRACPHVLQRLDGDNPTAFPMHYRVQRDETCLRSLLVD